MMFEKSFFLIIFQNSIFLSNSKKKYFNRILIFTVLMKFKIQRFQLHLYFNFLITFIFNFFNRIHSQIFQSHFNSKIFIQF